MKFTEEKAREYIEFFGLSEKTFRVWKSRGKIPLKYSKLKDRPVYIDTSKELQEWQNIKSILNSDKINRKRLAELNNIKRDRLHRLYSSEITKPLKSEFLDIKKSINQIRLELKKIDYNKLKMEDSSEVERFLALHENKLLVWTVIMHRSTVNSYLSNMRHGSNISFPVEDIGFIQDNITLFLEESKI